MAHAVTIGSSHAASAIATSLGATTRATSLWMVGAVIAWSVAVAILAHLGAGFIYDNVESEGLLGDLLGIFRSSS